MDGRTKFFCPACKSLQQTSKAMCVECGSLIGCTAVAHDESRPFHGCQDNGVLTTEILRLSRERNNLISSLRQIVDFQVEEVTFDFRVDQIFQDIKQVARNALKDHDNKDLA
tara:strand:- start:423 stop:758 length:336 start_codon:yes stop_codon:yes gene_type:complete